MDRLRLSLALGALVHARWLSSAPPLVPQVSADGEVQLYRACQSSGITLLSIGHRPALKRFHQLVVHIDGTVSKTGKGWWVEELQS